MENGWENIGRMKQKTTFFLIVRDANVVEL